MKAGEVKTKKQPKPKVYVVYQQKNGSWRGFCAPYDVTCQAETSDDAKTRIEELVKLYEKNLSKYDFPKHLTFKKLSDSEDRKIFDIVWNKIIDERYCNFWDYQLDTREEYPISGNITSFIRQLPAFV